MQIISKHYKEVKQGIRKKNPLDPYFISKYSFSPYMACQHACKYCDGRAEKYYVEGDYEKDIVIRKNLPELLELELPKLREKGVISIGSGISDPYQQVEKDERILRKCAELLVEYDFPVTILTKSSLIERDIDIWQRINQKSGVLLMMSLTTLDDKIRNIFEPFASSVSDRLNTLETFKKAGIAVGVLAMPFLPFITDSDDNIRTLLKKMVDLSVDFVLPGCLTLRPGIQKQTYLKVIEVNFPELQKEYKEIYRNKLISGNPIFKYRQKINKLYKELIIEAGLPMQIPHYIYRNRLSLPDELTVLLDHMILLYNDKGVNTEKLALSVKKYAAWILHKRSYFLRRRNLPKDHLDNVLLESIESGELEDIISNSKLFKFIIRTIKERRIFNYINLSFD